MKVLQTSALPLGYGAIFNYLMLLYAKFSHMITETPRVGLEPTTPRLTAVCSTIELSGIIQIKITILQVICQSTYHVPSELHTKIVILKHIRVQTY